MEGRVRGSAGVGVAALAAAMLVLSGLLAAPARAQRTVTDPFDLLVDVNIGECGIEGCPDGQSPVTVTPSLAYSTQLETLLGNDPQLTDAEIADILADAEIIIDEKIIDDAEAVTFDERDGEVLVDTIPDKLLPVTGGMSPAAVLTALGFALLLAGLSAGYAAARRGP